MTELAKIGEGGERTWEEVLRTATKHPDQTLTDDIGIDANKNVVNLDLWYYYSTLSGSDNSKYIFLANGQGCYENYRSI